MRITTQIQLISILLVVPGMTLRAASSAMFSDYPLHNAVAQGDLDQVSQLFSTGKYGINDFTNGKITPLHVACFHGHSHVAQWLLQNKAKLNVVSRKGRTPLHTAAISGSIECVELLLAYDASVNVLDNNYFGPLHCANIEGRVEIAEKLKDAGAQVFPLEALKKQREKVRKSAPHKSRPTLRRTKTQRYIGNVGIL